MGVKLDGMRLDGVLEPVRSAHAGKVVLADEVAFEFCYKKYGRYGYAHILENIVTEPRFKGGDRGANQCYVGGRSQAVSGSPGSSPVKIWLRGRLGRGPGKLRALLTQHSFSGPVIGWL